MVRDWKKPSLEQSTLRAHGESPASLGAHTNFIEEATEDFCPYNGDAPKVHREQHQPLGSADRQSAEQFGAISRQKVWQGHHARHHVANKRHQVKVSLPMEHHAIQSQSTAEDDYHEDFEEVMRQQQQEGESAAAAAALSIQRVWRGHEGRCLSLYLKQQKQYRDAENRRKADYHGATALQRAWRGHNGRKVAKQKKLKANREHHADAFRTLSDPQHAKAATDVQRVWRGHRTRREFEAERESSATLPIRVNHRAPDDDTGLPAKAAIWVKHIDPQSGYSYLFNPDSGDSRWEDVATTKQAFEHTEEVPPPVEQQYTSYQEHHGNYKNNTAISAGIVGLGVPLYEDYSLDFEYEHEGGTG